MDGLQVRVLGALAVHRHGQEQEIAGPRQRALLAALALTDGPVSVSQLVDAVWEDDPPERATTTLQTYVSRLRGLLGPEAVQHGPAGYRLDPDASTDVALLRSLVAELGQLRDDAERRADVACRALDLWRGPTLAELADHEWFRPAAVELDELRRSLVDQAGDALIGTGRASQALPLLEAQLASAPLREPTQVLLVRALHASGRAIDALRAADRYRSRLRDETGLDPGAELLAAEQEVLTGQPPPAPATRAPQATPRGALPRPTELIGRQAELAELRALVDGSPLVTVVGIGGVGKTRLVAELVAESPSRAWVVVDLDPVERGGVAAAIGTALGYRADRVDADTVAELVRGGVTALVLDSCEHVLDEVRHVVQAIQHAAPGSHVLATSRTRLDLPHEHLLHLGPLPTTGDQPEAVLLFLDRLRRSRAGADDHDHDALVALCARLDGVPLALELAASRAAALGVPVLTQRLDDAVDLLVDAPGEGRRSTLGTVVSWSVDLLDEPARLVLGALSTFHGEIDLEAAEAVAGALVEEPVAAVLGRLVDTSLVAVRGPGRWALLEMVRRFARRRLDALGRADEVHRAHARWVGRRLAAVDRASAGSAEAGTVAQLDQLRHDVGAAVRRSLDEGDVDAAGAIAVALAGPMLYRPDPELLLLVRRIGAAETIRGRAMEAPVLAAAARAAFLLGDLDDVDLAADRALDLDPDQPTRHRAAHAKGVLRLYQGRFDEAVRWFEVGVAAADAPVERLDALGGMALAGAYSGRVDEATEQVAEHRALADAIDSDTHRAFADYVRAEIELQHGNVEEAMERLVAASDRAWTVGASFVWGVASTVLGRVLVRERPVEEAARHLPLLVERWRRTSTWPQLWTTLRLVAELLAAQGKDDVALLVLESAACDPAATSLTGADLQRENRLRAELADRLGTGAVAGIRAGASSLDRVTVLERATAALRAPSP